MKDINLAIDTCKKMGNNNLALLKCTSSYPTPIDEANLCMIDHLKKTFNVPIGISDHTLGFISPIVAVSMGAQIIEKHFIIDKSIGGPDASFSLTKTEFSEMVKYVRQAERLKGNIHYNLTDKQLDGRRFSRSLYIVEDVKKGDLVSEKNIRSIRPGYGLHPKFLQDVLNKKFTQDLKKGTRLALNLIK